MFTITYCETDFNCLTFHLKIKQPCEGNDLATVYFGDNCVKSWIVNEACSILNADASFRDESRRADNSKKVQSHKVVVLETIVVTRGIHQTSAQIARCCEGCLGFGCFGFLATFIARLLLLHFLVTEGCQSAGSLLDFCAW